VPDFRGNLIAQTDTGPVLNLTQDFILDHRTNLAYIDRSNGDSLPVLTGRSIDQHLAVVHSIGQVEYGLTDASNSTTATLDQTGKLLASFSYEPFGETTNPVGSEYPFRFTGRVPTVGKLYYYRARYYDSLAGRFIRQDPTGLRGDVNLYRYVRNNPLRYADPLGLDNFTVYNSSGTSNGFPFSLYNSSGQPIGFPQPVYPLYVQSPEEQSEQNCEETCELAFNDLGSLKPPFDTVAYVGSLGCPVYCTPYGRAGLKGGFNAACRTFGFGF